MVLTTARPTPGGFRAEPILAQGLVEKAFPAGLHACTKRVEFQKRDYDRPSADDGFAMKRGVFTGSLAEHELNELGQGRPFTIELGAVADKLMSRTNFGTLNPEPMGQIRTTGIEWVRNWQAGFPQEDLLLDLTAPVKSLLSPQTDLFVRRPGRFAIRVRPDNVVGIGETLVAWEWSTAKELTSISLARYALNHHALIRELRRRDEWAKSYKSVVTRVEMLSLGAGFTFALDEEEAETWRVTIGTVAEAMVDKRYERTKGPHCSVCFWQGECWFSDDDEPF
jgi:hypothetical protein